MPQVTLQRWSILNLLAFIGVVIVNALAVILPINGMSTAAVSDRYPNLFVPAGFTFSIWSVIYSLLLAHVVFSIIIAFRKKPDPPAIEAIGNTQLLFFISCLLNMGWILLWHHLQIGLTVLVMLCFLVVLIVIYRKQAAGKARLSRSNSFFIRRPFLVYLGWISVATIANITAMLVYDNWGAFGWEAWIWACILIIIAAILGLYFSVARKDPAYSLVIAWALYGIYAKQQHGSLQVAQTAGFSCLIVLLTAIAGLYLNFRGKRAENA
jgi:hypothetical protein